MTKQRGSLLTARTGRNLAVPLALGVFILLASGLVSHYFFPASPPPSEAQVHWQKAQELIADREFTEASSHLAHCLESWPYNAETHFLMARCARRAGNLTDWKVHLARAETFRWPKDQITLEQKLRRAQVGDVWEVEDSLFELLNTQPPEEVIILEALVNGLIENDRLFDVVPLTTTWINRFPKDWLPLVYRGNAQLRLYGKPAEAVKDFQHVLELRPDHPQAHLALALVLTNDGQFKEAIPHYQFYLDHQPQDPTEALFGLASCQYSIGKTDQAREALDQLLAQSNNNPGAMFLQARIELAEGRLPEALDWLKKADALSPFQADVTNALVHVCGQLGLKEETALYKQRLDEIKKRDETLDRLVSEAKIRPDDPDIRFELGTTCLKYGRDEEASHWFQGILRKNPNHLPTLKALAEYYQKKGNQKLATHYRRKAENAGGSGSAKAPSPPPGGKL
jgi:tetratricopeptide (TPR) repeat protein